MVQQTVEVNVKGFSPEQIWDWMLTMTNEKYRQWHPDHLSYTLLRPAEGLVGMRLRFDEYLEGKFRINFAWEIVESEPPRRVVFRALIPYPVSLELGLSPSDDGTRVSHSVRIGNPTWYARALDPAIKRLIFTAERQAILERHVRQEFKNLEHLL